MSPWDKQEPRWKTENKLAESLGFTCVPDPRRGANWCKFVFGAWWVWSIGRWQVARLGEDLRYHYHYTRRHIPNGDSGVARPGFSDLKEALEYAKQQAEKQHALYS